MNTLQSLWYDAPLMIPEIFPEHYDIHGRRVLNPGTRMRRYGFRPTAPMGSYITQPLQTKCKDFAEMRQFLFSCRWRDMREVQRRDHWQPPEEFEETKTGDFVDFGLWAWRQVLAMGYSARFVGGKSGKYGEGHAWVTFERDGKHFLLEPQLWTVGLRMPLDADRTRNLRQKVNLNACNTSRRGVRRKYADRGRNDSAGHAEVSR